MKIKKFEIENKSKSLELLKQFNHNYLVEKILKQNLLPSKQNNKPIHHVKSNSIHSQGQNKA